MVPPYRKRVFRWLAGLAAVVLALAGVLLATFAVPLQEWRTGQRAAQPLPVVQGGPAVGMPQRIWIDADAACGHGRTTDPDDCLAILLLAGTPGLDLVGISTVFGNAPLPVVDAVTRDLVGRIAAEGRSMPQVHRGAAGPAEVAGGPRALQRALEAGPLTIVALGPLTNIAAALAERPDLQMRVGRLIAVMGRRPGHVFHPAEGRSAKGILFGHGPIFSDLNVAKDPGAAAAVLRMRLPVTLVPYAAARAVSLREADLLRLAQAGAAARWVAEQARGWLSFWNEDIGLPGFYPFDLVAAGYVVTPGLLDCAPAAAWIADDDEIWLPLRWLFASPALLVGLPSERPDRPRAQGDVVYCPAVNAALQDTLLGRLARP